MASRAPKQWSLTRQETITSFEAWRQNLQYVLSLDINFASFLVDGFTWQKKTPAVPLRGFVDDTEDVAEASRRTAAQKVTHLELMLGQIANYCPIISRNTIVKNCTSLSGIWQAIRQHFGFQSSGAHFLDFDKIKLEPGERPEDLFQRINSFVEDNLLRKDGGIRHSGENPEEDEDMSPSLENFIVLTWLRLIDKDLPALVKQRYGPDLRSSTLASLRPEISQALDTLLDEVHNNTDARVLRAAYSSSKYKPTTDRRTGTPRQSTGPVCPLCKQAGRPRYQHFLSSCKYLPASDKAYMSKTRLATCHPETDADELEPEEASESEEDFVHSHRITSSLRRVSTKQSPHMKVFHRQYPLKITLDTGAEISMITKSTASQIGAKIVRSEQRALQADGHTPLNIIGETHLSLSRGSLSFHLEALVVDSLDVEVLAGIPFMTANDISVRPAKQQIIFADNTVTYYGSSQSESSSSNKVRRTQAYLIRSEIPSTVVWPGDYLEVKVPDSVDPESTVAIECRTDQDKTRSWPRPGLVEAVNGALRIVNDTSEPQHVRKHEHFCQIRYTTTLPTKERPVEAASVPSAPRPSVSPSHFSDSVSLDPDGILPPQSRKDFKDLLQRYDEVFDPGFIGYNGAAGPFEANVNMGPVQPPQRKGRVPQYARDKLVELQQKFDELEQQGVFRKPEDVGINVEYLNPSFLVKKPNGGHRLVTAFADVGRYSKPQPSLLPDVDSTLRTIGHWKYMIVSDLTSAFYQIPLAKSSMKYCGVATPFRGIRVYTRSAMGMPGSETALEEMMCRVLGDCLQDGIVAKLADDLYCGGNTLDELITNWERVLCALQRCSLRLSAAKTIVCPVSTTVLGWIWSQGHLSASPHRIAVLSACPRPDTVHGLRSFIGAYKVLGRVLPSCSQVLAPLDSAIAGLSSKDAISWTDELIDSFDKAQKQLAKNKSVMLPRPDDLLWIVTDGSVSKRGLGSTLYITRDKKLSLAGFFSAKLRKHQVTWLPCEIEALGIAAAVKHFSPFIIQSKHPTCVLTDSQPCVQAIEKLCRGEFSASPRVTSFLSTVSRYQVSLRHLAGSANVPSDFASRNAPDCNEPRCQICSFIVQSEDSVVRSVKEKDFFDRLPFTSRAAWLDVQASCPDLRRASAHLRQGTRPSKKSKSLKDVKRYLNVASIAKDRLLVVSRSDPMVPTTELIVVPRSVLDGLVTALHIKLDHPSRHQLLMVMKRNFYALDLPKAVDRACASCHICASLQQFPDSLVKQSSDEAPDIVGISFAADVMRRNKQCILVLRETTTSFTSACLVPDERHGTLRDALVCLSLELRPLDGPPAVIRVDPAPGFIALRDDDTLKELRLCLEIGRVKNVNKNPVAEKAVGELEIELLRQVPGGGPATQMTLSLAVARLNARIRSCGLSAREIWTQRNQFTHEQIPVNDRDIIQSQHERRCDNHPHSEKSKHKSGRSRQPQIIRVGDLVYLYADKNKSVARSRYLVTSVSGEWCTVKKFTGNQLRSTSYKVKQSECFCVPSDIHESRPLAAYNDIDSDSEEAVKHPNSDNHIPTRQFIIPESLSLPADVHTETVESSTVADSDLDNDTSAVDSDIPESDTPVLPVCSRPKRMRKPPTYLQDYVT